MKYGPSRQIDRRSSHRFTQKPERPLLLRAVDWGLLTLMVLTPVILGGRIAVGRLAFVAAAVGTATLWCLYQYSLSESRWRRSGAHWLFLTTLAVGLLQVAPLPQALLSTLSPNLTETLPLWFSEEGNVLLGSWNTLSLTPEATWSALALIGAFGLVFAVAIQRIETRDDIERFLRAAALLTAGIGLFALVQYFTNNGKYFWCYEHPYASTKQTIVGTFTNRNHFAQFMALGLGPLIWCLQTSIRGRNQINSREHATFGKKAELETVFWGIALTVALFAGLMSLSRGGAMASGLAVTVSLLICYRGGLVGRRAALGIVSAAVFLALALSIWGYPMLAARLDDFRSINDLNNGGRLELWKGDSRGIAASWLVGHGLGSHRHVSPTYFANDATASGIQYTHAESGYVQVPFEAGFAGGVLVLTAIGLCAYWCIPPLLTPLTERDTLLLAAVAPGLVACIAHASSDFIWYVPGCMLSATLLAAAACRFRQMTHGESDTCRITTPTPKPVWAVAAFGIAIIGGAAVLQQYFQTRAETSWHKYIALCRRAPQDEELTQAQIATRANLLYQVTKWQPGHASAHAHLAKLHLKAFNNPIDPEAVRMDERHIRDTVVASQFESQDAMREWLTRAFEDRVTHLDAAWYHVRAALSESPSLGGMYLLAASLAFLDAPSPPDTEIFLNQAVRVRPGDGDVLFAVGQEKILSGEVAEALDYYRRAAGAGKAYQKEVFRWLAAALPSEAVLKILKPDTEALQTLRWSYAVAKRADQFPAIDAKIAAASEVAARQTSGADAAQHWVAAGRAHAALENKDEAVRCFRAAVKADGTNFGARKTLASLLVAKAYYKEAEKHLRWCLQRKPEDRHVKALLETAVEGNLRRPIQTAARDDETI